MTDSEDKPIAEINGYHMWYCATRASEVNECDCDVLDYDEDDV